MGSEKCSFCMGGVCRSLTSHLRAGETEKKKGTKWSFRSLSSLTILSMNTALPAQHEITHHRTQPFLCLGGSTKYQFQMDFLIVCAHLVVLGCVSRGSVTLCRVHGWLQLGEGLWQLGSAGGALQRAIRQPQVSDCFSLSFWQEQRFLYFRQSQKVSMQCLGGRQLKQWSRHREIGKKEEKVSLKWSHLAAK